MIPAPRSGAPLFNQATHRSIRKSNCKPISLSICAAIHCGNGFQPRFNYITLRRCSGGKFNPDPPAYNYEPFLRFMIKATFRALDDFEFYRKRYRDVSDLSPSAAKVLHCFKERPENRLQRRLIIGRHRQIKKWQFLKNKK